MRNRSRAIAARWQVIMLLLLSGAFLAPLSTAQAWTYKVIHDFCLKAGCPDGAGPTALTIDPTGNLFGTTGAGGKFGTGTVFELTQSSNNWHHHVLYSPHGFASLEYPVTLDVAGNVYVTNYGGGKYQRGSVFELVRPQAGSKWTFKTLHNFCKPGGNICPDGALVEGGLTYAGAASGALYDGTSPLFGSTDHGGWDSGVGPGTIFKLQPTPSGKWRETVIYVFCSQSDCADGSLPSSGGIVADSAGNLFGTTKARGANGQGTIFELVADSRKKSWSEQTLYNFCALPDCSDGEWAGGGLLLDAAENLFGVTTNGGASCPDEAGCGVSFKLAPGGNPSAYSVLHTFCTLSDCGDGRYPSPGLIMDQTGTLYGVTLAGGGNDGNFNAWGGGTVYALNDSETVLYHFCAEPNCADGEYPYEGLVMDSAGNIFGTTGAGGQTGNGVVFELSP
jgi:hypothetical protein